ncbi:DNA recombination and repair protein RecA [Cynara cardunculus var. scolymus]|uniref:DNA recombination and repair protein RecA n=1 Tax=Cynara cardunculus var. scolymus TaxID=59895 RepID=A0A103XZQ6_CYNCS|nr:DNA recombination and repair protein RecA [Cynara cardunculus var. scolymus]
MSKKDLALKQAIDQINTSHGKGSIMFLGQCASPRQVPVVSTGSFALDIALGVGGFPKGRVVEIYVPEASGETTLALHVIAEAQKQGGEQEVPVSNTGFYLCQLAANDMGQVNDIGPTEHVGEQGNAIVGA